MGIIKNYKIKKSYKGKPIAIITKETKREVNVKTTDKYTREDVKKFINKVCKNGKYVPTFSGFGYCKGRDLNYKKLDIKEKKVIDRDVKPYDVKFEIMAKTIGDQWASDLSKEEEEEFVEKMDLYKIFE